MHVLFVSRHTVAHSHTVLVCNIYVFSTVSVLPDALELPKPPLPIGEVHNVISVCSFFIFSIIPLEI